MKRYGNLFEEVCSFRSLHEASQKALRSKKSKPRAIGFWIELESELLRLERELRTGGYAPRPYRTFVIQEPKQRRICAGDFRDRVVHHSLCSVIEPFLERSYIFDSYACRKGKGSHAAILRTQKFIKKFKFYLKLDVRKFFDSVDHDVLKKQLRRKFKDRKLLDLFDIIIDHQVPWTEEGRGIPIGNLTSQHFANLYLDQVDHFIKDVLGIKGYVRYMDDMVLFGNEKSELWDAFGEIDRFLYESLRLSVKTQSVILYPNFEGISFLGFRVFPGVLRIDRRGWKRFRYKFIKKHRAFEKGLIDYITLIRSSSALVGHVSFADSRNLRSMFFDNSAWQDI